MCACHAITAKIILAKTIESVLSQTFTNFELIIIDNCSTDKTLEIVQNYARRDSRIIYQQNNPNLGPCSSGNRAILLSRGEYIKFLCSDDKLSPKCLEIFVDVLDKNQSVSLVTSFTKAFGKSDLVRDEKFFPGIGLLDGKKYQKDLLINGNWIGSPSSVMYRRRDLHIGTINNMWQFWLSDLELWIRLLGVGDAYVVPEILSFLRIHNKSESATHSVDFRLIRERLMLANIAFQFPHMYGNYTKAEQRQIHRHLLKRLVREGLGRTGT